MFCTSPYCIQMLYITTNIIYIYLQSLFVCVILGKLGNIYEIYANLVIFLKFNKISEIWGCILEALIDWLIDWLKHWWKILIDWMKHWWKISICLYLSLSVNFSYFRLLKNHGANFNQIWHKAFLGEGNSSLFKWRTPTFSKGT